MSNGLRLSGASRPECYDVFLDVDLEKLQYKGTVKIQIRQTEAAKTILLHAIELDILRSAAILDKTLAMSSCWYDPKIEMIHVEFEEEIPVCSFVLELDFEAPLRTKMEGFYRANYNNGRYMATTHFEPTDARRAFPCFDEPSYRAKFSITLSIDEDRSCVSNMPAVSEVLESGRKVVKFAETPSMPTYLVAFIVGDLEMSETHSSRGIPVQVLTKPGERALGKFALSIGASCLDFFEDFFDVQYPLPKMSMVSVPDFPIGAMENWGCITFRETAILNDEKVSSLTGRQRAGETICHEIAHMWFGNLVTVSWWEHLWLKEGFATWASMVAVNQIYPLWKETLNFTCTSYLTALRLDSLRSTHPIEVTVHEPGQINEAFDTISYLKAASLIRMLGDFIGVLDFRKALKIYLDRHQYGAATTTDLWQAISERTQLPMEDMMSSWTRQAGYPVINISESSTGQLSVSQERFTMLAGPIASYPEKEEPSGASNASPGDSQWMVPLTFKCASAKDKEQRFVLDAKEKVLPAIDASKDWYLLNLKRAGFYRVNYPARVWEALTKEIGESQGKVARSLDASERAGLISDAFALARASRLPTTVALDLMYALQGESEFAVWDWIISNLYELKRVFCEGNDQAIAGWKAVSKALVHPLSEQFREESTPSEDEEALQLRRIYMQLMLDAGDTQVQQIANEMYDKFRADRSTVPPELMPPVLSHHVKTHGQAGYEDVHNLYRESTFNEFKVLCLSVLGSSCETEELRLRTLDFALTDVRAQDAFHAISAVARSDQAGRELCWSWMQRRWDEIFARFSGGSHVLPRLINALIRFSDDSRITEVLGFFKGKELAGFGTALSMSIEYISADSQWRQASLQEAQTWFAEKVVS